MCVPLKLIVNFNTRKENIQRRANKEKKNINYNILFKMQISLKHCWPFEYYLYNYNKYLGLLKYTQ